MSSKFQSAMTAVVDGDKKKAVAECITFCQHEFALQCFPGDSTVVVRDRGRVALSEVHVGDIVLTAGKAKDSQGCAAMHWQLCFQPVLTFLHHDPEKESEMVRIQHELGETHLTHRHLIFAKQKAYKDTAAPIPAEDLCIGDQVFAPWIDGSLVASQVRTVSRVQKQGLFAPLLDGGMVLVDGTLSSCYAIPLNRTILQLCHRFVGSVDNFHDAAYLALLPLRLSCRNTWKAPMVVSASDIARPKALTMHKDFAGVHPYAWILYVAAASLAI